jgi:hypothetical protein
MPKAKVREAVLLSLGLEPRPALTSVQYAEPGREFERRLTIAAAHVDSAGLLRPLEPWEMLGSREAVTVSLSEFGAWARAMGWTLPEQFPAMEGAQPTQLEPQAAPAVAPKPSAENKPVQRFAAQDAAVLEAIREAWDTTRFAYRRMEARQARREGRRSRQALNTGTPLFPKNGNRV